MYAVNPDGAPKWGFITGDDVGSSPAIGADGTIYVGSADYRLYAIKPDGTLKWRFTTEGEVYSSPAIGADGTIYIGSDDHHIYAINPDGTRKWSFVTGDDVGSSPAIGDDGTIYVGSNDNKLYAIKSNGILKWKFTTGGDVRSSPTIGGDSNIYVGSDDRHLYSLEGPPAPHIEVSGASLDMVLNPGQMTMRTITIANVGDADLVWTISVDPGAEWLSWPQMSSTLAPGNSQEIDFTFDSAGLLAARPRNTVGECLGV